MSKNTQLALAYRHNRQHIHRVVGPVLFYLAIFGFRHKQKMSKIKTALQTARHF
jgi:hypothetical protein